LGARLAVAPLALVLAPVQARIWVHLRGAVRFVRGRQYRWSHRPFGRGRIGL